MDREPAPMDDSAGGFRWNRGGWLGAQLGGTSWILVLGALLLFKDPPMGAIALGCFAASNLVGWWLWSRRDRVAAYPAIQMMIAVEAVFALLVVVSMHVRSAMELLPPGSQVDIGIMYGCLLLFPGLSFQFWLQEREARHANVRAKGRPSQPMN